MSDLNGTPTPTPNAAPAMPLPELAPDAEAVAQAAGEATDDAALDDWASALAEQNGNDVAPAAAGVFQPLSKVTSTATRNDIDMILDIPVQMTVELGRTKIAIRNLLQLAQGSVVELDGLAGEPMDVLVNGCLIAQGEVVVVNDKFGIRLTDIITPSERIRKLNR
jgi:flagellar motor switch protein FliN